MMTPRVGAMAVLMVAAGTALGGPETPGLSITSSAFKDGTTIPRKYTGEGENVSPPLAWANVPAGAKELALIVDDPDAPRKDPWVHLVLYRIPATVTGLLEGNLDRGIQGKNDFGKLGYGGPMPPPGKVHHYHFKLVALKTKLDLSEGATKEKLLATMKGQILSEAELVGTYKRGP